MDEPADGRVRILVITDTHGHLSLINELAKKHQADVVLHCGDFGIYSEEDENFKRVPDRELSLRVSHSDCLPPEIKKKAFKFTRDEKIQLVKDYHLFGEFELFRLGRLKFQVPVYVVVGNHEDVHVVRSLVDKSLVIPNLHVLDEDSDVVLNGWIRILGIGGNFIHWNFFDQLHSDTFYPSMRFLQWCRLYDKYVQPKIDRRNEEDRQLKAKLESDEAPKKQAQKKAWKKQLEEELVNKRKQQQKTDEVIFMMTHVSPGKNPVLELFGLLFNAQLWMSGFLTDQGHMDPLSTQIYSLFTLFDDRDWGDRLKNELNTLVALYLRNINHSRLKIHAEELLSTADDPSYSFDVAKVGWQTRLNPHIPERDWKDNSLNSCNFNASLESDLKLLSGSHNVAAHIQRYLDSKKNREDKSTDATGFCPSVTGSSINLSGLPPAIEIDMMSHVAPQLLSLPQEFRTKSPNVDPSSPSYDPAATVLERTSSDTVKRGPTFINLPDCYLGGYTLIEADSSTRTWSYQTGGVMPHSPSIVKEFPNQIWDKFFPKA